MICSTKNTDVNGITAQTSFERVYGKSWCFIATLGKTNESDVKPSSLLGRPQWRRQVCGLDTHYFFIRDMQLVKFFTGGNLLLWQ